MYLNSKDAKHTVPRDNKDLGGDAFYTSDAIWEIKPPLVVPNGVQTHVQLTDATAPATQFHVRAGVNDMFYIELFANSNLMDRAGLQQKVVTDTDTFMLEVVVPEGAYQLVGGAEEVVGGLPKMTDNHYREDLYRGGGGTSYYKVHKSDDKMFDAAISQAIQDAVINALRNASAGWQEVLYQLIDTTPKRDDMKYGGYPITDYPGDDKQTWDDVDWDFAPGEIPFCCLKVPAPTPDAAFDATYAMQLPQMTIVGKDSKTMGPFVFGVDEDPGVWDRGGLPYPTSLFHDPMPDVNPEAHWRCPYYSFLVCKYDEGANRLEFNLLGRSRRRPANGAEADSMAAGNQGRYCVPNFNHMGEIPRNVSPFLTAPQWPYVNFWAEAGTGYFGLQDTGDVNTPNVGRNEHPLSGLRIKAPGYPYTRENGSAGNTSLRNMNDLLGFSTARDSVVSFSKALPGVEAIDYINGTTGGGNQYDFSNNNGGGLVNSYPPPPPGVQNSPGPLYARALLPLDYAWLEKTPARTDPGDMQGVNACRILGPPENLYDLTSPLFRWPSYLGYFNVDGADVRHPLQFDVYYRYDIDPTDIGGENPKLQTVQVPRLVAPNAPNILRQSYSAYVYCDLCPSSAYRSMLDAANTQQLRYVIACGIIGKVRAITEPGTGVPVGPMTVPLNSTRPVPLDASEISQIRISLRDENGLLLENDGAWSIILSFCFFQKNPWQGELPQYAQELIGNDAQRGNATIAAIRQAEQQRRLMLMQQVAQLQKNAAKNRKKKQRKKRNKKNQAPQPQPVLNPNVGLFPLLAAEES